MQRSLLICTTLVMIQPDSDRSCAAVRMPIIILPKHFITAIPCLLLIGPKAT